MPATQARDTIPSLPVVSPLYHSAARDAPVPFRLCASHLRHCQPQRICLIKPSAFGDVVQSLPVIDALRSRWPSASLTWVIRDDLIDLVRTHPGLDRVLIFHRRGGAKAFVRLLGALRRSRFDLVIDLQGLLRTAVMTLATGARLRVGLETAREGATLAHNVVLPDTDRSVPAWKRSQALGQAIGRPTRFSQQLAACKTSPIRNEARRRVLAVHPGSVWESKRWPVGRFAAVAARAARELQMDVVVIGGREQKSASQRFVADLTASVSGINLIDRTGQTSIAELSELLRNVDLLLTNDSGPMHLAAALGTPVVAVFTSTGARLSGPPPGNGCGGVIHALVESPASCAGCYKRRCPLPGHRRYVCHRELTVQHVWQELQACLRANKSTQRERAAASASPRPGTGEIPHAGNNKTPRLASTRPGC